MTLFTGTPGTDGTPVTGIPGTDGTLGTGGIPGIGEDRTMIPGGGLILDPGPLSLTVGSITTVQGILPESAAQPVTEAPATSEGEARDHIHLEIPEAAEVSGEIIQFLPTVAPT